MEKLDELIRMTELVIADTQKDLDQQKGLFDVSRFVDRIHAWNMRLEALREAKALWEEERFRKISDDRIQKPKPGSVNIEKVVADNGVQNDDFKPRMGLMAEYVRKMVNAPKSHDMDSGIEGHEEESDDGE